MGQSVVGQLSIADMGDSWQMTDDSFQGESYEVVPGGLKSWVLMGEEGRLSLRIPPAFLLLPLPVFLISSFLAA